MEGAVTIEIHLEADPARPPPPFAVGDRVRHLSHPDGVEEVLACKWESFGAPHQYWVATARGPELARRTRYASSDGFELASGGWSDTHVPLVAALAFGAWAIVWGLVLAVRWVVS
jgi:hypothetical protein